MVPLGGETYRSERVFTTPARIAELLAKTHAPFDIIQIIDIQ